ncbi:hypothetical protein [Amycolatopsis decaplanina]|nr:hypothetical protein [Amycolatopsis decaplanina]
MILEFRTYRLKGPREAMVSRIESYHTIAIETSEDAVKALERR